MRSPFTNKSGVASPLNIWPTAGNIELLANPGGPFLNTDAITGVGSSAMVNLEGDLLITSLESSFDRVQWDVSGLKIGDWYEFTLRAKQGSGSVQGYGRFVWAVLADQPVVGPMATYTHKLQATAETGFIRLYSSFSAGMIGDQLIVERVSLKKTNPPINPQLFDLRNHQVSPPHTPPFRGCIVCIVCLSVLSVLLLCR